MVTDHTVALPQIHWDRIERFISGLENASPMNLCRSLLLIGKRLGAISLSYYVAARPYPNGASRRFHFFSSDNALSKISNDERVLFALDHCYTRVLEYGLPLTLADLIPTFTLEDENLTKRVLRDLNINGVTDSFMIPVFGMNSVDAVISFGFPTSLQGIDFSRLFLLETVSRSVHSRLTAFFLDNENRTEALSKRERDVLTWIAAGKANSEIAIILQISISSVDTYTRRIYKKLCVNDRVSAAICGVSRRLIRENLFQS